MARITCSGGEFLLSCETAVECSSYTSFFWTEADVPFFSLYCFCARSMALRSGRVICFLRFLVVVVAVVTVVAVVVSPSFLAEEANLDTGRNEDDDVNG